MVRLARGLLCLGLLVGHSSILQAADEFTVPPGDMQPFLRVEPGGATSHVTALTFSADGKTLYVAGWDKVIRVWTLNDKGRFVPARVHTYRVPIGSGLDGAINTMALSQDDGLWLAVAGTGVVRGGMGLRNVGYPRPRSDMAKEMLEDQGTITVFNTRDGSARQLRGHRGVVNGLAFAPPVKGRPALLLSVAWEPIPGMKPTSYRCSARLWDVVKSESTKVLTGLPGVAGWPPPRPGLSVWYSGRTRVRAALSLSDGFFRVWNVDAERTSRQKEVDFLYTTTVVQFPNSNEMLTASYGENQAQLTRWWLDTGGKLAREAPKAPLKINYYPRALGLLSSRADGAADLAATVVRFSPKDRSVDDNRLQIVDLAAKGPATVLSEKILWRNSTIMPVLATSLRSPFMAVAGHPDHAVRVYSIRSLLEGGKVAPQVLASLGMTFEYVSFVTKVEGKDKKLGLLLNRAARRRPGQAAPTPSEDENDLVFAIRERTTTSRLAGWKTAAPPANGWSARHAVESKPGVIAVYKGKRLEKEIPLSFNHELSDYALLAPGLYRKDPLLKDPLLALATHENDEPRLVLYNARTGAEIRHFKGHTDRVSALAFSDDGRLLVSASRDQTVCVWSLTTFDQVADKFGTLRGVSVRETDGVLTVEHDSEKLRAGDTILGLFDDKGMLQRMTSKIKFYESILKLKPGSTVRLRVSNGGKPRNVTLEVAQSPDMRNPLFTWFALKGLAGGELDWIGWHPLGPFDASSARAESHLGWHFNTGDPKKPTRFALAGVHRKEFYREGLLADLVRDGRLYPKPPPPLPDPRIDTLIREGGRLLELKEPIVVVRQPRVELLVTIGNRSLATLSELAYKVDGLPEQKLNLDRPDDEPFVLSLPKLERGKPRVVEIAAWTKEKVSRVVRQKFTVSYEPVAPQVAFGGKQNGNAKNAAFRLVAKVLPSTAGEKVVFTIHHEFNGKTIDEETRERQIAPGDTWNVDRTFKLKEGGKNVIVLTAVNKGALPGKPDRNTKPIALEIYLAKKAAPPAIVLMVPDPDGKVTKWKEVPPSETVYVSASEVFVSGKINADENLHAAEWQQVEPETNPVAALSDFKPDKSLTFKEKLKLKPGLQTYRFQAKSVNSPQSDRELKIFYRPPLPGVTNVTITGLTPGNVLYGEKETALVTITGRISVPKHEHPYSGVVVVDDEEQGKLDVDERAGTFKAQATIKPGSHNVRIKLSNKWNPDARYSETIQIRYLRPPVFVDVEAKETPGTRILDFVARVRSPIPLLRESVQVKVNAGRRYSLKELPIITPAGADVYSIELKGVALDATRKDNLVQVWVSNEEAETRTPGSSKHIDLASKFPARVRIVSPGEDLIVPVPKVRVRIEVSSAIPLTEVTLVPEGRPGLSFKDVSRLRPEKDGVYRLTSELEVPLARGPNFLSLEAVNAGGKVVSPALTVNYVPPPLAVYVDRLVDPSKGGMERKAKYEAAGKISFDDMDQGKVRLEGRVVRADETTAWEKYREVRVFVNGFQQVPAKILELGDSKLERRFRADVLLNREKRNLVEVVLLRPDAVPESAEIPSEEARAEFEVHCFKPVERQRLHLLLLSPGAGEKEEVESEFKKAINPKLAAFSEIEPPEVLVGNDVRIGRIRGKLNLIKRSIDVRHREGSETPMNEVVMIYYQGREAVKEVGNFFRIPGVEKDAKGSDIPCDQIVKMLAKTSAAHVFLLDVERDPKDRGTDKLGQWSRHYPPAVQSHFVIMRHAWRGEKAFPEKARLISVLREALPKVARLRELELRMEMRVGEIRKGERSADSLLSSYHVPKELREMRFGR